MGAGALGDAAAAAIIKDGGLVALALGHGLDDRLGAVDLAFVDVHALELSADAGEEAQKVFHGAHGADLFELAQEVVQGEGALRHFLGDFLGFGFGDLGLGFFDEGDDIAHAENAGGDAVSVEFFDGVELFADADVFDGLAGDGLDGEGGAAAGVRVELGDDDAVEFKLLVEGFGGVDRILAGHGVDDEEDLMGVERGVDLLQLVHEGVIDVEAACGVEDEDVGTFGFGGGEGVFADLGGNADGFAVLGDFIGFGVEVDLSAAAHFGDLFGEDLELRDGCGALEVSGAEHDVFALLFELGGELATGGGFAGALEAAHHDDGGAGGDEHETGLVFLVAHELNELVIDELDHLLAGLDAF